MNREKIPEQILEFARNMRKSPTGAEALLWTNLRNKKINGLKFRRQHPVEGFILDFYCNEVKLGIEIDGKVHEGSEQKKYDDARSQYLNEFGIKIIRFTNEEVLHAMNEVLGKIKIECRKLI